MRWVAERRQQTVAAVIDALLAADVPAAVALWQAAGLVRPWNDPIADALRTLESPSAALFAARLGGRLVGTVMAGADGHRGWVYYLAVAADARRGGVGEALLEAAEDWCAAQGMPRLNLMVRAGAPHLLAWYAGRGYRASDVTVLQKDLPPGKP
jgi:GNAT superfamily N-acetyltransferase